MLEINQLLPINKDQARKYFLEPEYLKGWLCHDAIVNPCVGGAYELFWDLEDRQHNSTIGCKLTTCTSDYISFSWKGPIQFEDIMSHEPLTHVVVMFHEKDDQTQVTLLHSGWGSGELWDQAQSYFSNAWQGAFKILEQLLK